MANVNETPLDRYLKKVGINNTDNLSDKYSSNYYKNTKSDTNTGSGLLYTLENLGLGFIRAHESGTDFLVGLVGELFGADDFVDEIMKTDWVDYNHANEWYNPNGTMGVVGEIGQGVGAMVPAIVASAFTGGTAGAAIAGGIMGAQAAGQATSEATKESGTAGGKEWLYGIGSGLAEGAIEYASGGIGGYAAGTLLGKQVAKSTLGKLAVSAIGEGAEEVAGNYADFALRRATGVEPDAKLPTFKENARSFVVGAGVGGVLGGANRGINVVNAGGFNNLNAIENAQELSERLSENNLRQAEGKKARYTPNDMQDTARRLSANLQNMDADKRKAYMDSNPFMKAYFAEDGKLLNDSSVSLTTAGNGGLSTYSASLRGRENSFAYQPAQTAAETSNDAMNTVSLLTKGKAEVVLTDHDFGKVKDADGNEKKINGEYRNGIIYLSANATAEDAVRVVAKHEMAHTLEGTKEYNALGDYIREYIKKHPDLSKRYNFWDYAMAYANTQQGNYTAETKAYEAQTEIYADFIANEILNSQESVNRLANRDANIVKKFLSWVRTAIKNLGAGKEARAEYKELRRMEKMLAKALDSARGGVTLAEIDKAVRERKGEAVAETKGKPAEARASLSSISQSFFGEQVSLKDFESRKYKETEGYKKYVEECVSNIIQSRENLNEAEARKEIEASIDGIVDVAVAMKKAGYDILDVGEHRKARDSKKRLLFSSLEPNSDYFTSHDISTICDKRKNFAEIYDEIVAREEKMGIPKGKRFFANVDNYFVLHDILASKGLTASCKQCYVESMRKNLAPMANAFLELMQEKNASNRSNKQLFNTKGEAKVGNTELRENLLKTIAEEEYDITADDLTIKMLTTASGLAKLKMQAPLIYEAFNSFYGQSKPKMPRQAVPFRFGELSAMLRNHNGTINQTLVKKINSTGGFRLQSYSDFQIENWSDVLQVIFEAGTLGLNGHAYTKVPAFLDATEGTNLKRNISVFMYKDNEVKGVDKWRIDKKDSFPAELKDIYAIVQADASGNTGIIAVSQNDDMSAWIMANAMIAYGIPFHKSGIKMDTVRKNTVRDGKRVIEGYLGIKDHTRQQSEVWKKTEDDHKAFTRVKKAINIYEWWDFANTENLSQKKLIEKNVKRYIDECEKAGYYPKFRDYVMDNDGILNKIVAYSKAFGDANATVDSILFEYKGYRIPYGYYKFLGDFGMFKPNGKASPQKVLSLENYDFKKAVEYFSKPAELRREEILQQFDNETVREDYRKSDLTAEQLEEIVKQKRKEVADEIIDKRYGKKDGESRLSIDMDDIADFDAITFSKWFDELTIEELQELIGEDSQTEIETIESLPTKEERRQAYIERMYKQGNLNEAITKIVKKHPQMQAYFKNTQMNQKYNPLYRTKDDEFIVMFHGTPTTFNVFDTKKIGKHGTVMGSGLYFTENLRYAEDYKTDDGRVMATLLNIEKPLSRSKITMTKEELKRFIREVVDTDGEDYLSNYGDVYSLGYEKLLDKTVNKLYDYHTNDADMIEDIYVTSRMDFDEFHNGLTDKLGYDGIIAWNKSEGTQAVVFRSNQAKDIFNFKPTKNEDIRYSVNVNQTPQATKINTINTPKQKLTNDEKIQAVKDKVGEKWLDLQIQTTNIHAGIEHEAKVLGGNLESEVHRARASSASAINALTNEQRDYSGKNRVGDSLADIFEPVFKEEPEYTQDFYNYLYHYHNTDRMGLEEKAQAEIDALLKADAKLKEIVERKNIGAQSRERLIKKTENGKRYLELLEVKNIPVMRNELGDIVTATESKAEIKVIEKAHPEFKAIAEKVWKYSRNNIQYRLDAGLITQELADLLLEKYPHYVPTYREKDVIGTAGVSRLTKGVRVKQTIKKAKGSDADLADISMSLTKQTLDVYRAAAINDVAVKLHDLAMGGKSDNVVLMEEKTEAVNEDTEYNEKLPDQEVAFYKDGKRYIMAVSKPINEGFKAFTSDDNYGGIEKLFEKANQAFKAGVTSLNPLFLIRNFARDMQEAYFYTQYGAIEFSKAIPRAIKIMAKKGDLWQRYLAAGGLQSGIVSRETGVYDSRSKTRKKLAKPLDAMEKANQFIEQIPRFAEFILAIEHGKSDAQALLESADVTTNFSRGGKLAKKLNRTVMPFLNPSIQGFSKLWRTAVGRKSIRQWTQLIVKSLVVGLAVGFFNDLINGDDEDYKNLNVRDKENYYIFPLGDGKFIKIPKGRVVAALGTITSRFKSAAEGDENWNEGWLQSVGDMVTPVGQMTRFIWSPFTDARTNTTWYGGEIEGKGLQNLAVKDRYDEGTSSIAIWMGKTFNISPKKVHYVIDQYSGVIGDIILPLTTEKAERGMISSAFTIDGVTSNRISTNFYDMKDEMMYAKNSGDMYADMVYSYLNKVSSEVSDMYQQKREIQSNSKLSNKEKLEQTKVIQALINTTMQSAMVSAEQFEQILIDMGYTDSIQAILKSKAYNNMDEETQTKVAKKFKDYSYAMAMSTLTGEKTDAKYYLYNSIGAEDISIYLTEISGITADKDKKGNVTTSRKEKVHKYIESLKLSKEQKYILMYLAGYTPTEEGKKYVEKYLRKNSFTAKELEKLWE